MRKKILLAICIFIVCILLCSKQKANALNNNIIEDGIYTISSSINPRLVVTVKGANQNSAANVDIETNQNLQNQKFRIIRLSDGYYKIEALHSGKALDVYAAINRDGANVDQYTWNNTDAQKWKIEDLGNGEYSFISKCNNLYLDVFAGLNKSGTNIQVYSSNNTKSQRFTLTKIELPTAKRTIEDGLYTIHMAKRENSVLQVLGNKKTNGAEIGIANYNRSLVQKFHITYLNNGYYQIKSIYSDTVLDVYGASNSDGAKVDQYPWNNTSAQQWIIKDNGDGTYSIISNCNNLYLDIYGGNTNVGTKAQMYSGNNTIAQKFKFKKEEQVYPKRTISDGVYVIKPSYDDSKVIEVSGAGQGELVNIHLNSNSYKQNQKFHITQIGNSGYYKITALDSAKVLDVYAGAQENLTNVSQYSWNNSDAQQWIIKDNGDGTYSIISKCNDLYLDIEGGYSRNGANVQVFQGNNTIAQKFRIQPVEAYPDGEYEIETKLDSDKIMDIAGGIQQNAARVQVWEASNVMQQKFVLNHTEDYYIIKAKHSGKVLTAGSGGIVYQYDYTGELGQRWVIQEAGNGYYNLVSKLNNWYLTIANESVSNGTPIYATHYNGRDTQKFKFFNGVRKYVTRGTYGVSGLAKIGDSRGSQLEYIKLGKGNNVLFATFSIHGFEDSYNHDGSELTYIAQQFQSYLENLQDTSIFYKWSIYIFPGLNPDGQIHGWTNNGPGRTSLVSASPTRAGIDLNRNWQASGESYVQYSGARNYNGTAGFQGYEARELRDFLLANKSANGQTLLVDLHGWLNETIGDNGLGIYYRRQYNMSKHISSYGRGYLVNWARQSLGGTRPARSVLVELPQVTSHSQLVGRAFAQRYILATMQMLEEIN